MCVYIYIYIEREREREREIKKKHVKQIRIFLVLFIFDCSQLVSAFCNYQEKGITEKTVLKCFFNIILKS